MGYNTGDERPVNIPLLPVLAVVFAAALVRATFGFGDALVGMPLLALWVPLRVATPLMALIAPVLSLALLFREWRHINLRGVMRLIVSTVIGIPFGLLLLKKVDESLINLGLAAVIILFAAYNLIRPGLLRLRTDRAAPVFGFIAGILGAAYNTNGPPVVVYGALRGWPPEAFRATLQGYFLPTGLAILIGQGIAGLWAKPVVTTFLASLPAVFLAVVLGRALGRRIPAAKFRGAVHVLMLALGLVLMIKTIS
jgi:uncharacterized membrane protein YfcA